MRSNPDRPVRSRFDLLQRGKKRFSTDGLSSLKYRVKRIVLEKLYTRLLIDLGKP